MADKSSIWLGKFTFAARKLETVKNEPGCWDSMKIGIFHIPIKGDFNEGTEELDWDKSEQIGTYNYNYSSFNDAKFMPFKRNGKWYALYSTHYTATRVMEIFQEDGKWTWKDVCGENPNGSGFCPVEFYVPCLFDFEFDDYPETFDVEVEEKDAKDIPGMEKCKNCKIHIFKPEIAFVAGCCWGDDQSWKLQIINLKKIDENILEREERFGYLELPNLPLKDLIDMRCSTYVCGYNRRIIKISGFQFDLDSGELLAEHLKIATKNTKTLLS